MELHPLFDCLSAIHPVSIEFSDYLLSELQVAEYKKGHLLLRENTVCTRIWWLRKGLVRFFYHINGHEVSHCFFTEGNIIVSIRGLHEQDRSKLGIEAVEDCATWWLDIAKADYLYERFPEAQAIGRITAEQYYISLEKRLQAIALRKSFDRYRYLEKNYPELLQRVSLKYLASFLDLEEHTISRMRKNK